MKTYYYTYKIILLKGDLAGKYYYGQHRTTNLKDGYAGSGVQVRKYYSKFGCVEGVTFTKEILAFYNTQAELDTAEYLLIGDLYKSDPNCLNLCAGGSKKDVSLPEPQPEMKSGAWWISDPNQFNKYCKQKSHRSKWYPTKQRPQIINKMSKTPNKSQREFKCGDKTFIIPTNVEFIKRYRNRYLFKRIDPDCWEVVKFKDSKYPSDEDFGTSKGTSYGVCISSKDRNLESKIEKYLKYGF